MAMLRESYHSCVYLLGLPLPSHGVLKVINTKSSSWETFMKYFQWHPDDDEKIKTVFKFRCGKNVSNMMNQARNKALEKAAKATPPTTDHWLRMHDFPPKWVSKRIWTLMVEKWKDNRWTNVSRIAARNILGSVPEGQRVAGTYRGGSITQEAHYDHLMAATGGKASWVEVYIRTRNDQSDAIKITDDYRQLMDAKYPPDTERPGFDRNLWMKAAGIKTSYVRGFGRIRKASSGLRSRSSSSSSLSCSQSHGFDAARMVDEICNDRNLLSQISQHLKNLDHDELAEAVADAAEMQDDRPTRVATRTSRIKWMR